MPAQPKGTVLERGGRFYAQITVGKGKRRALLLPTYTDPEQADARTKTIAGLVARLREAGLDAYVLKTAEQAATADEERLAAIERVVAGLIRGDESAADAPFVPSTKMTFQAFAEAWTSGKLHRAYPDHVPLKRTAESDEQRLAKYVYPVIGSRPLAHLTLADVQEVMRGVPRDLAPASRRHVAQTIHRVFKLATYPCQIIAHDPIPDGFLPRLGSAKALEYLYPEEDARLLACVEVPLALRLAYGFLAREGMRSSELAALTFGDLDLERGAVNLDENKTDDPRSWALGADVVRALKLWRDHFRKGAKPGDPVIVNVAAKNGWERRWEKRRISFDHSAARFREHLQRAGVDRPALFERSKARLPIRVHDLRATFVTLSLANGKTETWVADRTGHRSSDQINRYRRAARKAAELNLGWLRPLDEAIPELAALAPPGGRSATGSATGGAKGHKPSRPRVKNAGKRRLLRRLATRSDPFRFQWGNSCAGSSPALRTDRENKAPESNPGGGDEGAAVALPEAPGCTSQAPAAPGSRAALLADLGRRMGELAAAGDVAGARLLNETIARLLGLDATGERASVADLDEARRRRRR